MGDTPEYHSGSFTKLLNMEPLPLPPEPPAINASIANYLRKLHDYLRRLTGKFTATNIVNVIRGNTTINNLIDEYENGTLSGGPVASYNEWIQAQNTDTIVAITGDNRARLIIGTVYTFDGDLATATASDLWANQVDNVPFQIVGPTFTTGGGDYNLFTVVLGSGGNLRIDIDETTFEVTITVAPSGGAEFQVMVLLEAYEQFSAPSVTV